MNDRDSSPDKLERHLSAIWSDRINLRPQSAAHADFSRNVEILRYELAEGADERKRLEAEASSQASALQALEKECAKQAKVVADLDQERNDLLAERDRLATLCAEQSEAAKRLRTAEARIEMLEQVLTRNLRSPWRPLKDYIQRRLAFLASGLARPFSRHRALKFRRSADKRNPRRYLSKGRPVTDMRALPSDPYEAETQAIFDRFFPNNHREPEPPLHLKLGSAELVRQRFAAASRTKVSPQTETVSFSIVTPFFAHLTYFESCVASVADLLSSNGPAFEWIIFNDDPSIADDALIARLPERLRACTRVLSEGVNLGITGALDRGIRAATTSWVALLDCDDQLEPDALRQLQEAIRKTPGCRYFTSLMIDIDPDGQELRRRRPSANPTDLFAAGMVAGHMVAFRTDLYRELGGFDLRFSGVQDYHFALRVSAREGIGQIPHHLYRYRWHGKTQSIGRIDRQARLANAARVAFLRENMGLARTVSSRTPLPDAPRLFCVIRTQGKRMDLMAGALESVRAQSHPTTPCIVVHGDEATLDAVRRALPKGLGEDHPSVPAVLLQAPRTELRRGYPCNVAIDYLKEHAKSFDLLCFLDDDDHLLPLFADRLVQTLQASNADMAYGLSNALPVEGEPFVQHRQQPWSYILAANFIAFNSFVVRVDRVLEANIRFEEDMHYLEDHHFLVQLAGANIKASALPEVVSEYRLLGDGNVEVRQFPEAFDNCQERVRKSARIAGQHLPQATFWDDVLSFPAEERSEFDEAEILTLLRAKDMIKGQKNRHD